MPFKPALDERLLKNGLKALVEIELVDKQCADFVLKDLNVGSVNHNFYVSDKNQAVLFKILAENDILPIDRQVVFDLQTQLASIEMAAKPLFLSDDHVFYCEQWIYNSHTLLAEKHLLQKVVTPKQALRQLIPSLAEALYNVHNSHIAAPILKLSEHLQTYWSHINCSSQELFKEYVDMQEFCDEYFSEHRADFVLCHNDLNLDHVCSHTGLILDWEYAACGCRYFDIAHSALINQFDVDETKILCREYAKLSNQNSEDVCVAVQNVFKLAEFTTKLWLYAVGHEAINE